MTYNATDRILYQAVDTGQLVQRYPLETSASVRRLFVTPEINEILDGNDAAFKNLPMVETETIIGRFCAGHFITASLQGNSELKPDFEKLQGLDEVWAICARKPRMWQVRIFGRFISKGCFVAFGFHERVVLGIRENYNAKASEVPALWNDVLGTCVRYEAGSVDEYFGGVCRDVDEQI
ncbi:hypothetical protein J5N58_14115 [Rhizobium cremeum]|uniref:hypothetical protein n=1 Tax=Rhizobium cremeum TaxID=2813827 RepID=UPI0013B01533|nr:hypothetical protein [Rhizobium cremeum]MCJ7995317.1 hypothetical protein [Rhizobium cremeum]MCJ8000816.1 hypothetical protein [Rhizobium cremeum]